MKQHMNTTNKFGVQCIRTCNSLFASLKRSLFEASIMNTTASAERQ